jgi:hypothetical protein
VWPSASTLVGRGSRKNGQFDQGAALFVAMALAVPTNAPSRGLSWAPPTSRALAPPRSFSFIARVHLRGRAGNFDGGERFEDLVPMFGAFRDYPGVARV